VQPRNTAVALCSNSLCHGFMSPLGMFDITGVQLQTVQLWVGSAVGLARYVYAQR
jgi:hypothetical protein